VARKPNPPQDQPVLIIGAEIRLYAWEPELLDYFSQFKPRQYATAIKRAVRTGLLGGDTTLISTSIRPTVDDEDESDLDDFVG
jgi:hypothetical protein